MERGRTVIALVLIALGVVFLVGQQLGVGGESVVAAIGIAFLVAYFLTRNYAFLVPGGIMTGLGLGIVYASARSDGGPAVVLGLGLGFLGIYALSVEGREMPAGWWPLIPGGILTAVGLGIAAGQEGLLGDVGRWWPVILIALGVYLLLRRMGEAPRL